MIKYYLVGGFKLSKDLPLEAIEGLSMSIKDLENTLLRKGLDEGEKGATVEDVSITGNTIRITIVSVSSYIRADDALLRIKNWLKDILGRDYKIGIRDIFVDDYKIELTLDKKPIEKFEFPFLKSWSYENNTAKLELDVGVLEEEALRKGWVSRLINTFVDRVNSYYYEGKEEYRKIIWSREPREHKFNKDPTIEMIKRGWIRQGPGPGQWHFDVYATWIINALKKIAVEEVFKPLGFQEIINPKVVPFSVWEKTGHLAGSEPEIYFVSLPKSRDIKDWSMVIDTYKITKKAPVELIKGMLKDPMGGNCYAQCPNIYWAYSRKVVAQESLPILVYDMSGTSNRNEAGGKHGIERVNEFHRLEPVYIGTPEQVEKIKEDLIKRYEHVFNDILDLEWRYAEVTPFYMQQSGSVGLDKDESGRWKGTIDFEALLPYKGREGGWLEFQNLSVVGDKYTKAFGIKSQKGEVLWSGCSGIGFERWLAVFLAQHGLDEDNWPKEFKKFLGPRPKEIKFV